MSNENDKLSSADPAPPFIDPLTAQVKTKVELTQQDKENFFKSFLADKPYEEEVGVLGGKFKLRFSTITVKKNNDLFRQIVVDQKAGIAQNNDSYFIKMTLYRLGLSLKEIDRKSFYPEISDESSDVKDGDTYVKLRSEKFNEWQTFKLGAVLDAFRTFELKVNELTQNVQDPSFWTAAA